MTNTTLTQEEWRQEISSGTLWLQSWEGGVLLLRRREKHAVLNFYLQDTVLPDNFVWDGPTVLEIAARPRDEGLLRAAAFWRTKGFQELFRRERLTLPKDTAVAAGEGLLTARIADLSDAGAVYVLFRENFDLITGCLPTEKALEYDLNTGNIVCAVTPEGETAGLLHITPGRGASQLRHLAVRKKYRRQGGAQRMLACYLEHTGYARSQVWVRTDNEAGQRFYRKNGYAPDGWTSTVLYRL